MQVAPVRERGLKSEKRRLPARAIGRSREGAWIEICYYSWHKLGRGRRSREGAWIEINRIDVNVIPQTSLP